ncbi:MAG: type II secretion system protein GspD [Bdellovibrionales bacterium RIFOXYD12_FULL_39_22]|nr:MAG: type II secretion system protein GspD [Bdellovibrionales bacterium RIFOXYB1_FULL_39_21]OFZ41275.1 MAG: type II secretion system protein GspD [Bdellovibrionales bacterium RIFOXYC12_FULL_39_17]OFZ45075.1 MAG: type II secretion system protein GspD [Bdellovibrionales bacterium RIFOXYC1_FULL_39_130]OFZ74459.1 MAG: type II secretion system protein GspD [Bdellovibrionales bacterium RIFOXYD1_FULL_39_84]OFZ92471.1 MAG: type II secretion system protein GspD [Bdellovibrionales bacterium RIFOXYD12_
MKKSRCCNLSLFLSLLVLLNLSLISDGSAQSKFKKYQSRSSFDAGEGDSEGGDYGGGEGSEGSEYGANEGGDEGGDSLGDGEEKSDSVPAPKNIFGRKENNEATPKAKEYVNLNPETAFGPEVITSFNFPNTSLTDLTQHMQKLTGLNLILDKELKGKISIIAPSPITVGDAWKAYLTALSINGYALVNSGAFYQIVQSRDIRYASTKIYSGNYTPDTENYVMKIIPLKHISSVELTRQLRTFVSRYGRMTEINQTNTVIVQDTGANINRLDRLIKLVDVPGHERSLQIIPVKHSSAQEIAKLLEQIIKNDQKNNKFRRSGTGDDTAIGNIIAESRTNSIIAMVNDSGEKELRNLIAKLDVKLVSQSGGQIHVYYLNYGDSETLSKTLSTLINGMAPTGNDSKLARFTKSSPEDTLFSGPVKITSDKENNALVITASPTDYLTIQGVIKKLDVPKDQVYVEGMILETAVKKETGMGINIVGRYGTGVNTAGFTAGSNDLLSLLNPAGLPNANGLYAGAGLGQSKAVTLPGMTGIRVNNINAMIKAFGTDSNTNVLATPQILATDNMQAVFEVGDKMPVMKKTAGTNGNDTTSVDYIQVGITLKITPHINKATRFIKLDIDQKIEDFSTVSVPAGVQDQAHATTARSAVTTVTVRDRDTVAMGGLMRDKLSETITKVPLLGDIPILGWLFKDKKMEKIKMNVLFFFTPKILSPYEENVAKNVKDVLNRRSAHLKTILGDDDPFGDEMKAMYDKAGKQQAGPLFDQSAANPYSNQNVDDENKPLAEETEEEKAQEEAKKEDIEKIEPLDPLAPGEPLSKSEKSERAAAPVTTVPSLENEIINDDFDVDGKL